MKNKNANIFIVGIAGFPARYGGFETLVSSLIKELKLHFVVFCEMKYRDISMEQKTISSTVRRVFLPINANGWQSLVYDAVSLMMIFFYAGDKDRVLILGVSGAWVLPFFSLRRKLKVIVNVDGIEWRRQKWGRMQQKLLKILEGLAVRFSNEVIADNYVVYRYLRFHYRIEPKIAAYGGEKPRSDTIPKSELGLDLPRHFALSICRVEPENNVHVILSAFKETNKNLIFVGNWMGSQYGRRLYDEFSNLANIKLLQPIYDPATLDWLRKNCELYVHGHSAGGSNPSLIEMMFYPKPIIAFECSFNKHTLGGYGLFFSSDECLAEIITNYNNFNPLDAISGTQMFALENYLWPAVASKYQEYLTDG